MANFFGRQSKSAKSANLDKFDRVIAPTMRLDETRRILTQLSYENDKLRKKLESELGPGEQLATRNEIIREHREKTKLFAETDELMNQSLRILEKFDATLPPNVDDIEGEQQKYQDAIANALPPVAYKINDIGNRMKSEYDNLRLEMGRLTLENQQLREVVNKHMGAMSLKDDIANLLAQPRVDPNELSEAREKALKGEQRANRLDGQVTELQRQLDSAKSLQDAADKEITSLSETLETNAERVHSLEKKYQKKRKACKHLSNDLINQVEENENLGGTVDDYKRQIMELTEERRRLFDDMEEMKGRNTRTVVDSIQNLQDTVAELRKEKTELQDEIDELGRTNVKLKANMRKRDDEINDLEEQKDELKESLSFEG